VYLLQSGIDKPIVWLEKAQPRACRAGTRRRSPPLMPIEAQPNPPPPKSE
jgi:hypothetical protein